MLTYTSTALATFIVSLGFIPCFESATPVARFQSAPASQEIIVASTHPAHQVSYRGSGRGPDCSGVIS